VRGSTAGGRGGFSVVREIDRTGLRVSVPPGAPGDGASIAPEVIVKAGGAVGGVTLTGLTWEHAPVIATAAIAAIRFMGDSQPRGTARD
jgi:hypothetical protein